MRWMVHGNAGQEAHEENVREAFMVAAPAGSTCDIMMAGSGTPSGNIIAYGTSYSEAVQYAIENDYDGITRSYTGIENEKVMHDLALENGVLPVWPHGSNSNVELLNPPRLFSAMACSGGISSNLRSWGNGLELFDQTIDGLFGSNSTAQSFSTPTVAGRIAHLIDAGWSIHDARQAIRQMCELPGTETAYPEWSPEEGYGKAAFFPLPASPLDLDVPAPLDILTEVLDAGERVRCSWMRFRTSRQHATRIKIEGGPVIYEGTEELFEWRPERSGTVTLEFYHLDKFGNASPFAAHAVREVSGLVMYPAQSLLVRRTARGVHLRTAARPGLRYRWRRDGAQIAETAIPEHLDEVDNEQPMSYTLRLYNPATEDESADGPERGVRGRAYKSLLVHV